jgi:hypothetical protein
MRIDDVVSEAVPEAHVVQSTSFRARLRFPGRHGDEVFFADLVDRAGRLPGVSLAEGRARSASLVLIAAAPETAIKAGERAGLFRIAEPGPPSSLSEDLWTAGAALDRALRGQTGERLDLLSLGVVALVGLGVVQMARGRWAMPAIAAFLSAADLVARKGPPSRG